MSDAGYIASSLNYFSQDLGFIHHDKIPPINNYDTFTDLTVELITRWIGSSIHVVIKRHEEREIRVYFAMMQGMESNIVNSIRS